MARTHIIVEADGDKYTFEAIIRHIELQDKLSVDATPDIDWTPISKESDYPATALIEGLRDLIPNIVNERYDKIAIIRDMDLDRVADMLALVNHALQQAFSSDASISIIENVGSLVPFTFSQSSTEEPVTVLFTCYFIHRINKKGVAEGEMEDILKAISAKPSPIADCVDKHLPECLEISKENRLTEKQLVKLWINNYQRYDTLTQKLRKDGKQTTTKYIMENRADIYNFGAEDLPEFNELKAFLQMMSE
jgi:hypothetical protein